MAHLPVSHTMTDVPNMPNVITAEFITSYQFRNPYLLFEALQAPGSGVQIVSGRILHRGNESLAIVGDAALTSVLSTKWYREAPSRATGKGKPSIFEVSAY
jgi:hypothetical protein